MRERRAMASRPYYRKSAERDYAWLWASSMALSLIVGAMLGASIAVGVLT